MRSHRGRSRSSRGSPPDIGRDVADAGDVQFVNVGGAGGIDFTHVNGASPDKHLVENDGRSGGLFFDYDNDGWIDIFLVDGGSLADPAVARRARHRLFRNRGNGTFEDVTAQSGIAHRELRHGRVRRRLRQRRLRSISTSPNVGPNALYRNAGDGSVHRRHRGPPASARRCWSTSCAFADLDRDGDLDLFVTNYVDARASTTTSSAATPPKRSASTATRSTSTPLPNVLYRNNGNGTFTDVSARVRHRRRIAATASASSSPTTTMTAGRTCSWPTTRCRTSCSTTTGKRRFSEVGAAAGVAVASDGRPRAGMGTDFGDYDGDGRLDLVVTNLEFEMHSLFRNLGGGLFADATVRERHRTADAAVRRLRRRVLRLRQRRRPRPRDRQRPHHGQRRRMFAAGRDLRAAQAAVPQRRRGRFAEVGRAGRARVRDREASAAALAAGDIDNDGDLDLLVTNNGGTAESAAQRRRHRNHALLVRLVGTREQPQRHRRARAR